MAEAEAYPFSEAERAHLAPIRAKALVGAPEQVKAKLEALAAAHGVQEVAVLTPCHDQAARQRSYRLLAEAFGLGGQDAGRRGGVARSPCCLPAPGLWAMAAPSAQAAAGYPAAGTATASGKYSRAISRQAVGWHALVTTGPGMK